jgi:hypothetical protein
MSRCKTIAFVALQRWIWKALRRPARLRIEEMEAISPNSRLASREKSSKAPSGSLEKVRKTAK